MSPPQLIPTMFIGFTYLVSYQDLLYLVNEIDVHIWIFNHVHGLTIGILFLFISI